MLITLNGTATEVAAETTLADLLPEDNRGTAVAINGQVVTRDRLAEVLLAPGDRVEIVTAVQGG